MYFYWFLFDNNCKTCYEKVCYSLLVEADIFTGLGVSFCVTQNSINFDEKKERKGTVQKYFYALTSSFF